MRILPVWVAVVWWYSHVGLFWCLLGLLIPVMMVMQLHAMTFKRILCFQFFGNSLGRSRFCSTWPCPCVQIDVRKEMIYWAWCGKTWLACTRPRFEPHWTFSGWIETPDLNAVGCWSHLQNACILYNLLFLSTQQQSIVECPNWIKVKWHWWVCVCVSWSVVTRICKIYHYNWVSCSSPGHSSRSSLLDAGVFCTLQECCLSGLFWTADTLSILCVTTFQFRCLELTQSLVKWHCMNMCVCVCMCTVYI